MKYPGELPRPAKDTIDVLFTNREHLKVGPGLWRFSRYSGLWVWTKDWTFIPWHRIEQIQKVGVTN